MLAWIKQNKKLTIALILIALTLGLWVAAKNHQKENYDSEGNRITQSSTSGSEEVDDVESPDSDDELAGEFTEPSTYVEGTDEFLMDMQPQLRKQFGTPPKGFIWDTDGRTISLGDKDMSSEDVLYAYLRGISTLDFATAQKYSRESVVVDTYASFFDESRKSSSDYLDSFIQSLYRESLLSLEIEGIENYSNFAQNKVVYTVNVSMLDLSNKDFWLGDKEKLFESMYVYENEEDDSTKLELFLYDYILNYYKSGTASKRTFPVDITLQRYPDIDSGWLVSIDTDIDKASKYTDGKLVTRYMVETFREYVRERQLAQNNGN